LLEHINKQNCDLPSKGVAFGLEKLEEGIKEGAEGYRNDTSRVLNRVFRRESQIC